ncbi:MAG: hypothetical protein IPN76_32545 [Saprospiraceae bacterium]|nr:hypothetical protein [Saprospiraceae bacterium]
MSLIDLAIVEDYMIKLSTAPSIIGNSKEFTKRYEVNLDLDREKTGNMYKGEFTFGNDGEGRKQGYVDCERFENNGKYMLMGKWIENEFIYTWWASINKK